MRSMNNCVEQCFVTVATNLSLLLLLSLVLLELQLCFLQRIQLGFRSAKCE